ncbi:MAG: hypothetical protein GC168_10825 [Candidatus Hydrogenedens sp.]|nr:hypothetical protein [Candidatus Hydrogenedens sp.]
MRWFLAGLAVLTIAGCASTTVAAVPFLSPSPETDRENVARVLDATREGIERGQIYKVLAQVAPYYADDEGRNYDGVKAALKDFFRGYRRVRLTRTNPRLHVEGDYATALESIGLIAEPFDPERHTPLAIYGQVTVRLARQPNGSWAITYVSRVEDGGAS